MENLGLEFRLALADLICARGSDVETNAAIVRMYSCACSIIAEQLPASGGADFEFGLRTRMPQTAAYYVLAELAREPLTTPQMTANATAAMQSLMKMDRPIGAGDEHDGLSVGLEDAAIRVALRFSGTRRAEGDSSELSRARVKLLDDFVRCRHRLGASATYKEICQSAMVDRRDFARWRKGQLHEDSVIAVRIARLLSGRIP